jgi:putative flippase GtrA
MKRKAFFFTFVRYFISGGTAFLVHMGGLVLLMEYGALLIPYLPPIPPSVIQYIPPAIEIKTMGPTVATTIAFCMASIVNYTIQYHWTFKAKGSHKRFFSRYLFVTLITLCFNAVIFWYAYERMHISYLYSQLLATAFVFVVNFIINYFYTFKMPKTSQT